jgi:hypothetical protein
MNDNALQITIRNAFYRCTRLMARKSQEYSPNEDRLENFKAAGEDDGVSPEEALWGMVRKHLTSLSMMCRDLTTSPRYVPQPVWEEKLTDAHNYLFLLEALVKERYGWKVPEGAG